MTDTTLMGSRSEWTAAAVLAVFLIAATSLATPTMSPSGFNSDGARYAAMAEPALFRPGVGEVAPWCWRPLTPYLASWLPVPTREGFRLLGFVCNFLSLLILYAILRRVGVSFRSGIIGLVLYGGLFWTLKFSAYSPGYIDFMTQSFLLAILYAVLARWFWSIPILLSIGVVQKESLLLIGIIPIIEFARRHPRPRSWIRYALATLGPAVIAILAVRMSITPINDYSSLSVLARHLGKLVQPDIPLRLLLAFLSGLGIAAVLPMLTPRSSRRALREQPVVMSLLALGCIMPFGAGDKARLLLYMAPAAVILSARSLDILLVRWDRVSWVWLVATLVLHLHIGHHLTAMGTRLEYLSRMVPMHARGDDYRMNLAMLASLVTAWIFATVVLIRSHRLGCDGNGAPHRG